MAQIGPPDFSKKDEKKTDAPLINSRLEKRDDGSTVIDVTEAVVVGKKLFSALRKGTAKVVESGNKSGVIAAAMVREKVESAKRKQKEKAKREEQHAVVVGPVENFKDDTIPESLISDDQKSSVFSVEENSLVSGYVKSRAPIHRLFDQRPMVLIIIGVALIAAMVVGGWVLFKEKSSVSDFTTKNTAIPPPVATDQIVVPQAKDPVLMPVIQAPSETYQTPAPVEKTPAPPLPFKEQVAAPTVEQPKSLPAEERPQSVVRKPKTKNDDDIEQMDDAIDGYFQKRQE
jgi:hypothetical protein